MRVLVLGGTQFLGRHVAAGAVARGHELSLFNRGRTNPDLFPEAEHLVGDRDGGLAVLADGEWEAVIDCSGYVPRLVAASAAALAGRAGHYTFISSISVYADIGRRNQDEEAELARLEDEAVEEVTPESYGGLKVLCEEAVRANFPGTVLVARPGLIVGPYDPTGRFTYWPLRLARGGELVAPGDPTRRLQLIDARDIADWVLDMAERDVGGTFNLTGPLEPLTMGGMLERGRAVANPAATLTWLPESFLLDQGVAPWSDLPFWLTDEAQGLLEVNLDRLAATNLTLRPLEATIRDILAWEAAEGATRGEVGLDPERERALLEAWHEAQG